MTKEEKPSAYNKWHSKSTLYALIIMILSKLGVHTYKHTHTNTHTNTHTHTHKDPIVKTTLNDERLNIFSLSLGKRQVRLLSPL